MMIPAQRTKGEAVSSNRLVHHIEGRSVRPPLPEVIDPFVTLARHLDELLEPGPEKTTALRKLLESCDAAVRCRVADNENKTRDQKVAAINEAVQHLNQGAFQ